MNFYLFIYLFTFINLEKIINKLEKSSTGLRRRLVITCAGGVELDAKGFVYATASIAGATY